jgi:hypothetical protein
LSSVCFATPTFHPLAVPFGSEALSIERRSVPAAHSA